MPRFSSVLRVATVAVLALLAAHPVHAQRNQPIYPAYDGFLKNPDGSYTLAFAYFSHNAEPVTVPAGPQNSFTPGPIDRGQTVTFQPGHHRFQCVMVVPANFDGKVRWTVAYAGTTTSTSQDMLQSNYNLVEGAAELRRIDFAKAPKFTCLNRAPSVRILGMTGRGRPLTASIGEQLSLFGSVEDEGLPRPPGALTIGWTKFSGPGTVTFDRPTQARTHAMFSAAGTYELELTATDSVLSNSIRVTVNVK
jgi:hypothetical protein